MKASNIFISFVVGIIVFFVQQRWFDFIGWVSIISNKVVVFENKYEIVAVLLRLAISTGISVIIYLLIRKVKMDRHFGNSTGIIRGGILQSMREKVDLPDSRVNNQRMDSFIQSPLQYVSESLKGNQAPVFKPDERYQEVLFGGRDEIKYIVAITSENPNLFLDPTIGFYMSNCYAASLVRHVNDFLKTFNYQGDKVPQLCVQDLDSLEEQVETDRLDVIERLKEKNGPDGFEFIRFFIFDGKQKESCDNAIFPSLKASQDLFRTFSYYVQREPLKNSLKNKEFEEIPESQTAEEVHHKNKQERFIVLKDRKYKSKWDKYRSINEALWHIYDDRCDEIIEAKEVQKRRIDNTIPEFLFVFYEKGIEVHTYLAGHYWKRPRMKGKDAEIIKDLISLLAEYVSEDKMKGQLDMEKGQINKRKTFINWHPVSKEVINAGGAASAKKEKPATAS